LYGWEVWFKQCANIILVHGVGYDLGNSLLPDVIVDGIGKRRSLYWERHPRRAKAAPGGLREIGMEEITSPPKLGLAVIHPVHLRVDSALCRSWCLRYL
jgi:hypothetical protein